MSPLQKRVLDLLTEWGCLHRSHEPEVIDRLQRVIGSPRSSIRGRITELRSMGAFGENFREKEDSTPEKLSESRTIVTPHDGPVDLGDAYLLHLPSSGLARISKADLAKLKAAYSNWDGAPETINQICRAHSITRADFKAIKSTMGWTHDSGPYLREDLERAAQDPAHLDHLVEDLAARGERALELRWNRKRQLQDAEDAARWRAFKGGTLDPLLEYSSSNPPRRKPLQIVGKRRPYAVVARYPDVHIGKATLSGETLEEQVQEVLLRTEQLIAQVTQRGLPERVYLTAGDDLLHIDNRQGTTTRGTPQDVNTLPERVLHAAWDLQVELIDRWRTLAPVEVVVVRSNHAGWSDMALMKALELAYRAAEDVEVHQSFKTRQYLTYGQCLLGFCHGDAVKRLEALASRMAVEAADHWHLPHRYVFSGDKHHLRELDHDGVVICQAPSISGDDRWHEHSGYTGSRRWLVSYVLDPERGMVAREMA